MRRELSRRGRLTLLVGVACLSLVATPVLAEDQRSELDEMAATLRDAYCDTSSKEDERRNIYEQEIEQSTRNLLAKRIAAGVTEAANPSLKAVELERVYRVEMERADKQIGASARSSASTSAVEKPGIAQLLGLAVETGAITQEENKTGVTLSTSPYAFLTLAVDDDPETYVKYDLLRRFGVSATFGTDNSGDAEDRNFDPEAVTEVSAKYVLYGDRSPRSAWFHEQWTRDVLPGLQDRAATDARLLEAVINLPSVKPLRVAATKDVEAAVKPHLDPKKRKEKCAQADLTATLANAIAPVIENRGASYDVASLDEQQKNAVKAAAEAVAASRKDLDKELTTLKELLVRAEKRPQVTAGYTFHRKVDDTDYSEIKVLAEYTMFADEDTELVTFTANGSLSLNHSRPSIPAEDGASSETPTADKGKKRDTVRDYSISLSLEKKIPNFVPFRINAGGTNEIALALSGKLMRLEDDNDEIGVAQAKATIPLATGVDFPVSVTYATRSEYVDEDEVRGNFGITVDTDKLVDFAKLSTGLGN